VFRHQRLYRVKAFCYQFFLFILVVQRSVAVFGEVAEQVLKAENSCIIVAADAFFCRLNTLLKYRSGLEQLAEQLSPVERTPPGAFFCVSFVDVFKQVPVAVEMYLPFRP